MRDAHIIEEYRERTRAARLYREIGAVLLIVTVVVFTVYAIERVPLGDWGGAVLAGGIVLGAVTFALAILSMLKLSCPNCGRVVGEVWDAAFCPACGAALRSDADFGVDAPEEPPARGAGALAKRPGSAARSGLRAWEPRTGLAVTDDFPEEGYPKNIRMFTTTNELELTKRYITLIDKDNRDREFPGAEPQARKRASDKGSEPEGGSKSRPKWRDESASDDEAGGASLIDRLVDRIRRL